MADYGKIINRSIEISKKYKWLWVYGLALAATAGGSGGGNFGRIGQNFGNQNSSQTPPLPISSPLPFQKLENSNNLNQSKEVLETFTNSFLDWLTSVSPQTWFLLFIGVLGSAVLGIVISWVLSAWLNGSLIAGLRLANQEKEVTLKNSSPLGIKNIKGMIVLTLIQTVVLIAIFLAIFIVAFGAGFVVSISNSNLGGLAIIPLAIFFIWLFLQLGLTAVLSQRALIYDSLPAWKAWKKGWRLTLRNFFPTILMGIISGISGVAFGCVTNIVLLIVLGIPGFIFGLPLVNAISKDISNFSLTDYWGSVAFLAMLLIIFGLANIFLRALIVVFSASNWNLWFEELEKREIK